MSIWIDIEDWRVAKLPNTKLTRATLTRYAKGGQFHPPARKIGRAWHVLDDAQLTSQPAPASPRQQIADPRVAAIFASA
ncbi:MAG: hypothetical protein BWK73_04705 [Thiothrix lacustris]|uniref:Excisionase n=1 Tax=Thiothrix lacustris TaxID=525917 RepID=A0A1Y1QXN1_9GAMM|nr:MAG: hypothetical protein BWK73_04705 [Thiothrix lacustris]